MWAAPVQDNYARQIWRVQDGLPEDTVQAVVEDAHGLLWVATTGGVASFDGSEFSMLGSDGSPGLPANSVFCLITQKDGSVWMGSEGGGLFRLRNGKLQRYGVAQGLTDPFVRALLEDAQGRIWVGTDHGLFLSPAGGGRLRRMDAQGRIPGIAVHALVEDGQHVVWAGGTHLLGYPQDGGAVREMPLPGSDKENRVKSMLPAADGTLWVGTVGGLERMRGRRFEKTKNIPGTVRMLRQTSDGSIWAGTIGHGLWRLAGKGFERVDHGGLLPSKSVLALFEDKDHQLWVGTQAGLVRLSQTPVHLIPLPLSSDPDFETVSRDRDDSIWVVASGVFHVRNGAVTREHFPALGDPPVRNLYRATDGALWVGTDGRGAFRLNAGQVEHFTEPRELSSNFIRAFLEGRRGDMWIGTDGFVSHVSKGGIRQYGMGEGLAFSSIRSLLESRSGDVWIGTEQGLSDWHAGRFVTNAATNALAGRKVWALAESGDGVLWIGTRERGLFRVRGTNVLHLTEAQGLPTNAIYGIAEHAGRLWFSGPNTLFSASLAELEAADGSPKRAVCAQAYRLPYSAENAQFYGGRQPAMAVDAEGRMWFPSSMGLMYVDTRQVRSGKAPVAVAIGRVLVDGQQQSRGAGDVGMSADAHRLVVNYAPRLLMPQDGVRFRYRLEGFDKGWTFAGPGRTASYTNLPAGSYSFHVQALDGISPSGEAVLEIVKEPHFWQTWWFAVGGLLVLGGAVWAGLRLRERRVRERFEAVLIERARLAREMHDTLIQGCTGVSALLEGVASRRRATAGPETELLNLAREQVRTTINDAREAVWDLRYRDETERRLGDVLEALAAHARRHFPVEVICRIEGEPVLLAGRAIHEVSMMVREAVGNAAVHGRPGRIEIVARVNRERVVIRIADDGTGFVLGGKSGHFGIQGMRERTEQLGGTLCLESTPGLGAVVELVLCREALRNSKRMGRP